MGIRLCYKWDKPEEMVKVEEYQPLVDTSFTGPFSYEY
jgi:hypothetical protein